MAQELVSVAQRYILESQIAEGGMASLWRARDSVLARHVAVKILHPELSQDEDFVARFRGEALAAARLAHPHVIAIYDTGQDDTGGDTRLFVVMEYCSGGSLKERLSATRALDPSEVVDLAIDICAGLGFAHRSGIVHRDIKPQNVLFNDQGMVKVGDFGIAEAAFTGDIATTRSLLGSVSYIAPEQAEGREPDERSDIYSLGAVLYECLVGGAPFAGRDPVATAQAHIREEPPPLRSIKAGIPRALDAAVLKALSKAPEDRYMDADEFADALRAAMGAGAGVPLPAPSPGRRRSRMSRRTLPVVIVAALIAAVAVIAGISSEDDPGDRQSGIEDGPGGGAGVTYEVRAASDFDPHAGDGENPHQVELALDGDDDTAWNTSSYRAPLHIIKPGVGLVFDLGEQAVVQEVDVVFGGEPGYAFELRASRSPADGEEDFELIESVEASDQVHAITLDDAVEARFWLVWLTRFPDDRGGRGSIAEVRFFGP